jgi:hypothetical protein
VSVAKLGLHLRDPLDRLLEELRHRERVPLHFGSVIFKSRESVHCQHAARSDSAVGRRGGFRSTAGRGVAQVGCIQIPMVLRPVAGTGGVNSEPTEQAVPADTTRAIVRNLLGAAKIPRA